LGWWLSLLEITTLVAVITGDSRIVR